MTAKSRLEEEMNYGHADAMAIPHLADRKAPTNRLNGMGHTFSNFASGFASSRLRCCIGCGRCPRCETRQGQRLAMARMLPSCNLAERNRRCLYEQLSVRTGFRGRVGTHSIHTRRQDAFSR